MKGENRINRSNFVKRAIQDPEKAAHDLTIMAEGLKNCKNKSDVLFALSEIFHVSERTIYGDLQSSHE